MNSSIALVMIVRDESKVIKRCLESVREFIDCWLIVDTGSKDNTKNIIRETLKDIPGELYDRPWVNFGHNRSEVLEIARDLKIADYSLILDADDIFTANEFSKELNHDGYYIEIESGGIKFNQLRLFSNNLPWEYFGAVHEYPSCSAETSLGKIKNAKIITLHDGHSWSDPNKYRRQALMFENALLEEPGNPRNVFYLAQSYRDCGDLDNAIKNYNRRLSMGGWQEEKWYSLYQLGCLYERQGETDKAIRSYLDAYNFNPKRAEPLYGLCRLYRQEGTYLLGYTFGKMALFMIPPDDGLFISPDAYDKCLYDELSICAFYIGKYKEGEALCNRALRYKWSETDRKRILENRDFCTAKL